eukprot:Skav229443  [mRNA]  locus=scaffold397:194093:195283:- [translate_table: standard]
MAQEYCAPQRLGSAMSRCLSDVSLHTWKLSVTKERNLWEPSDGPVEPLDWRGFNLNPLVLHRGRRAATTFLFDSFNDKDIFGQEVEDWGSSCPPFLPGGKSHTHGFCRKIDLPPKKWYPPENPEPQPGVPPPAAPPHRPRVQPQTPQTPWELPAQSVRQEQMLAAQPAQVPVTEVSPQPRAATMKAVRQEELVRKEMRRERQDRKHHKSIEPPFVSPEAGDDVSRPPSPPPAVKVDPVKPRPPLIVEQKTEIPKREEPEVGIVEEEPSIEEQLFDADPKAKRLLSELTEENLKRLDRKELEDQLLPKNPPGTPKELPYWPPPNGTAPPMQPIPSRPGEPNYNYGWTPPQGEVPYSPPWPGGAPLTAVDRVEAVAAELGNEASAAVHAAEDVLLNTT